MRGPGLPESGQPEREDDYLGPAGVSAPKVLLKRLPGGREVGTAPGNELVQEQVEYEQEELAWKKRVAELEKRISKLAVVL